MAVCVCVCVCVCDCDGCTSSSMDPEQKEQLVEVIEKLLKDQTTVSYDCFCHERALLGGILTSHSDDNTYQLCSTL